MADAEITQIIDFDLNGSADDGDPNTNPNPGNYRSINAKPAATRAQDGNTKSASSAAKPKELAGNVHAIPGKGPGAARAASFNKVVTGFDVNNKGTFQFDIALDVKGITTGDAGKVTIETLVNVQDLKGTHVAQVDHSTITADGKQNKLITGSTVPEKGVTLAKEKYQLEIEFRLIADAPASEQGNSRAEVQEGTFTIELKK
jgi:hypothetical protein